MSLAGKTIFISGGSRGIGLAIALRAARDGANIAVAAKTAKPHAKLEGTIYTAAVMRRLPCIRAATRGPFADCVYRLRRLMEARMGTGGRREFIQVLRLMENFHQHQVEQAVSEALRLSAISFDAVKMLLLARLENRPARLDLTFYPYLPAATVGTTDPRAYLGLIAGQDSVSLAAGAQA